MQDSCVIFAFELTGETEISYFEDVELRKEYVFWFYVSVSKAFLMKIMKPIHHLMQIGPSHLFWELSSICNEIEQLASTHILQNNGKTAIRNFISLLISGIFSDTDKFDQILMVKLLHDTKLVLESLEGGSFLFIFFDGDESTILILAQFNSRSSESYCAW